MRREAASPGAAATRTFMVFTRCSRRPPDSRPARTRSPVNHAASGDFHCPPDGAALNWEPRDDGAGGPTAGLRRVSRPGGRGVSRPGGRRVSRRSAGAGGRARVKHGLESTGEIPLCRAHSKSAV